jgi:NADPH:quinone reductase-like Zn-dependent oxidoreductase
MKAVTIAQHGGPDVVQVQDVPDPQPAAGEVVIETRAASLNHLDIWVRKGRPGMGLRFPHILGSDAAGVVAEVGPGVQGVRAGEEVILNPVLSCGSCEYCLRGEQSECPSFSLVGLGRPGTFAERVAVPAACVHPKPAHLDFKSAAALPLAYVTAWRMLMTRARLAPGETLLIHGIGGGVALAGLQIAKLLGAEVIVTSGSQEKLNRARSLGADSVVNYRTEPDLVRKIRDLTAARGVDVVMDTVGAATWPVDFAVVRRGGRIVICGVTTGAAAETPLNVLYWNQVSVLGSTMGSHEDFRQMLRAVAEAKLEPVLDSAAPLDRAAEAMARMEAGEQFGKIVLTVGE